MTGSASDIPHTTDHQFEAEQRAYWANRPPRVRPQGPGRLTNEEWRERVTTLWRQMPAHLQQRVTERLIEENPRLFWMTIIALLDAEQHKQDDQEQDE